MPRQIHVGLARGGSSARAVVRGGWGSAAGLFGKRDEASRPGPMSLSVADDGSLLILDQVNRRVVRYDEAGQLLAQIPIASEATEDIVSSGEQLFALVCEGGASPGYRIERYLGGHGGQTLELDRAIQLATGLFVTGDAAAPDLWVEQRHDIQTRVLAAGRPLAPAEQQHAELGRPDRGHDGQRLSALRTGPNRARVLQVVPGESAPPPYPGAPPEREDRSARLRLEVSTALPLVAIQELETDRQGRLFLGLLVGHEGPDGLEQARKLMLVVERGAHQVVPLFVERITDVFRPVAVGPDGQIYQLQTTEEGVTVWRWELAGGDA